MTNTALTVTRKFEFDAGHRIPNHQSLCKHLHGHRYVLEVTLTGTTIEQKDARDFGMMIDFGDIKHVIKTYLVDEWDHAFLVYDHDDIVKNFLATMLDHKTVVLPCVPTAENLVAIAFAKIEVLLTEKLAHYNQTLKLQHVRLYETPNCWADYFAVSAS